jgi:hypothetical protein
MKKLMILALTVTTACYGIFVAEANDESAKFREFYNRLSGNAKVRFVFKIYTSGYDREKVDLRLIDKTTGNKNWGSCWLQGKPAIVEHSVKKRNIDILEVVIRGHYGSNVDNDSWKTGHYIGRFMFNKSMLVSGDANAYNWAIYVYSNSIVNGDDGVSYLKVTVKVFYTSWGETKKWIRSFCGD